MNELIGGESNFKTQVKLLVALSRDSIRDGCVWVVGGREVVGSLSSVMNHTKATFLGRLFYLLLEISSILMEKQRWVHIWIRESGSLLPTPWWTTLELFFIYGPHLYGFAF